MIHERWFIKQSPVSKLIIFLILINFLIWFVWFFYVRPPVEPPLVETFEQSFTGKLVTVSYENSWFGLGNPRKTTVIFKNLSDFLEFSFDSYLIPETGKNYTVIYNIERTTYYNFSIQSNQIFIGVYYPIFANHTKIFPLRLIDES